MKHIYLIGGPMGVGKTTVSRQLKRSLPHSVFLDGDWCWDSDPFLVNDETKCMVTDNICHLLNNFIHCSVYENIIFCWVMHKQSIIDEIVNRLDTKECTVKIVSLICDDFTLKRRLQKDIDSALRSENVIERSLKRLPLYDDLHTIKIDTSDKNVPRIIDELIALANLEKR